MAINNVQYDAANLAEFTSISTALAAHSQVTFTPIANTSYLIWWQAMIAVGADGQRQRVVIANSTDGTILTDMTEQLYAAEYAPISGVCVWTAPAGTQSSHTFQLQHAAAVAGQTVKLKESRMLVWDLSTQDFFSVNDNDQTIQTSGTGTFSDIVSLTFTPYAAGDYLLLGCVAVGNASAAGNQCVVRFLDYNATPHAAANIRPRNTADRSGSYFTIQRFTALSASPKTFKLQMATNNTSGRAKYARLVAIRLDRVGSVAWAETTTQQSTAAHTEQTGLTLAFTTGASANLPYTVVGSYVGSATDTAVQVMGALNSGIDVLPGQWTGISDRCVSMMFHYAGWAAGTPVNPAFMIENANSGSSTNAVFNELHLGAFQESGGVTTTPTGRTLTPEWNVLANVAATRTLEWDLLNTVSATRTLEWDIVAQTDVYTTITLEWDQLQAAAQTAALEWDVLQNASAQRQLMWNVLAAVSAIRTLLWNILQNASASRTLQWDELANVNGNISLLWNLAGLVSSLTTLEWDELANAGRTLELDFDIQNGTVSFLTLEWDQTGNVSRTLELDWAGAGTVYATLELDWDQLQNTDDRRLTLQWDDVAMVSASADLRWAILQQAQRSAALQWQILQNAGRTLGLSWDELQNAGMALSLEWDAFAFMSGTVTLSWSIHEVHIDLTLPLILRLAAEPAVLALPAETPVLQLPGETPVH